MFETSTQQSKSSRWAYFASVSLSWVTLVFALASWGVMAYDARLNEALANATLIIPPPPAAPPAGAPKKTARTEAQQAFVAAKEPPKEIRPPSARPSVISSDFVGVEGGDPNGDSKGVPHGIPNGIPWQPEATPPPVPLPKLAEQPGPEPPKIVRKSGGVLQGEATRRPAPQYPPLAKAARVSGAVMVEVTVDEDGGVISARAVSGHPLLKDAAVNAARSWRFTPTKLSGVPVKVIGTITFNFTL